MFGGEVESLTTAGIEGVGVRVIVDHRQGYASAGSLDPDVIDETLREARDNAAFGEPDEWNALATPGRRRRRRSPPDLDLWREELAAVPTDEKVRIALELEAGDQGARSRACAASRRPATATRCAESAIANSLGVEARHRRTTVFGVRRSRSPTTAPARRPATASSAGRSLADLDLESIPRDAVDRAVRLLGAKPIAGRRIPVIFDPLVTRSVLGVLSSAFNGEIGAEGPVAVRGPRRRDRSPRRSSRSSTTRPTRARSAPRRTTAKGCRRAATS